MFLLDVLDFLAGHFPCGFLEKNDYSLQAIPMQACATLLALPCSGLGNSHSHAWAFGLIG